MPTTAFSTYYSRELDVGQLARLMLANAPNASEEGLSDEQRAWVRKDVRCSSCGVSGAQIVRAAKAAGGHDATRQAHFGFVGDDATNAHHRFCEFHDADGQERQSESLVDFSNAKTIETRMIGQLVCRGSNRGSSTRARSGGCAVVLRSQGREPLHHRDRAAGGRLAVRAPAASVLSALGLPSSAGAVAGLRLEVRGTS